jgi:hypothetical protein
MPLKKTTQLLVVKFHHNGLQYRHDHPVRQRAGLGGHLSFTIAQAIQGGELQNGLWTVDRGLWTINRKH